MPIKSKEELTATITLKSHLLCDLGMLECAGRGVKTLARKIARYEGQIATFMREHNMKLWQVNAVSACSLWIKAGDLKQASEWLLVLLEPPSYVDPVLLRYYFNSVLAILGKAKA